MNANFWRRPLTGKTPTFNNSQDDLTLNKQIYKALSAILKQTDVRKERPGESSNIHYITKPDKNAMI